ncbi:MAG: phage portal protein [Defluviitaleaceae bacterium]|nr:phage portal protein [Defluviitaleaceae bacterium]
MSKRAKVLTIGDSNKTNKRVTKPANRKCCGFFAKSVNQLCMYLLGNGASLPADVKERLGADFDVSLQRIGRHALIDGCCWGFWTGDSVIPMYATEFFGLNDERTSEVKIGMRFYQADAKKPMFVEVFEIDGISVYRINNDEIRLEAEKRPYYRKVIKSGDEITEISVDQYSVLPVIALYGNDNQESYLSCGLKNDIDLYDRIMSDFGDNLDRANDIYYVVQNYGGANLRQLIEEIEEYRTIYTDGDSGAQIKTIDVPYAARSEALRLLERQMYKETQTLDTEELSGGGLTNVAIKAAMTELDLKADMFEWQAESFVAGILKFLNLKKPVNITFRRRSLINDAETISNIYKMRADIDQRTALELNPLIPESRIDEILRLTENSVDFKNRRYYGIRSN